MALEQVEQRRQAVGTIHDIVNAMRAIAAGRIHKAQAALDSARRYNTVVLRAAQPILSEIAAAPLAGRRTALLLMAPEQPLSGALSQNVIALGERRWHELRQSGPVYLVVVGQRGQRELASRGIAPDSVEPAASSLMGLRDLVKRLAALLATRYAAGDLGALCVIYGRYQSISEQVPAEEQILPPERSLFAPEPGAAPAKYFHYLTPHELAAGLLREYAFITLYRIAAEAYASEQASRLVAMDAATHNTERMLEELRGLEQRERQAAITRQVLELLGSRFAAGSVQRPADPT